jgi:hypothetical protein
MGMSPEARAAASERMKRMRADQKAKKADPALQEALAKAPFITASANGIDLDAIAKFPGKIQPLDQVLAIESPAIRVSIDWQNISISEGESFYAILKNEFEKAGRILNARRSAEQDGYTCFMCHKHYAGRPGMTDLSYQDPKTGLFPRVDLCGELCVVNYHKLRIDMRTAKHIDEAKALQEA